MSEIVENNSPAALVARDMLEKSLDELEEAIGRLLRKSSLGARSHDYEEAIGVLTIEKSELAQHLLEKNRDYEELKSTAIQVAHTLKQSIGAINLFLKSNQDDD